MTERSEEKNREKERPLLEIRDLTISFGKEAREKGKKGKKGKKGIKRKERLSAVSFSLKKGEFLCFVGESGSGKSIMALSILRLLPENSMVEGQVLFQGEELTALSERGLDHVRGTGIAMVFQDPLTSLNPVFTVRKQLLESIRKRWEERKGEKRPSREEEESLAKSLLLRVGLPDPEGILSKYPFALSGGQRQRVMIAMALAGKPSLLIADEPTTALDVTIQAQIMDLFRKLNREEEMSVMLITHDIGLVAQTADTVCVMYAGQIVEKAEVHELFRKPLHPYTRALLQTVPGTHDDPDRKLRSIPGMVPEDYGKIAGCRFYERCSERGNSCREDQELCEILPGHFCRCGRAGYSGQEARRETDEGGRDHPEN